MQNSFRSRAPGRRGRRAWLPHFLALCAFVGASASPPAQARERVAPPRKHVGANTLLTRLEVKTRPTAITACAPVLWTLRVVRTADGRPETRFAVAHEKLMHLVIVSADLHWFNHVHPDYHGKGVFTVTATLPEAGTYRLFADYTKTGGGQVVLQQDVGTGGQPPSPTMIVPVLDVADAQGWMHQRVRAIPESHPEVTTGPEYRVSMMSMPAHLRAGEAAMLHFRVEDAGGEPLRDLQPYLGAMGHAVILSSDSRTYLHAHPMEGAMHRQGKKGNMPAMRDVAASSSGPDVTFHTEFPRPGVYKAWGQFQHRGKIVIAPFIFNVDEPVARPSIQHQPGSTTDAATVPTRHAPVYVCPMHADVTSADSTASCPRCGMHLVRRGG